MRPRQLPFLALALALLSGCGSRPDRSEALSRIRHLHVAPAISAGLSDAAFRLEPALRSAVERTLGAKGYAVGSEADAQASVRVAWILGRERSLAGQDERTLSLSLSVFSRSGERLYSGRSAQVLPERMWSEDRVGSEISLLLRDMPESRPAAPPAKAQ